MEVDQGLRLNGANAGGERPTLSCPRQFASPETIGLKQGAPDRSAGSSELMIKLGGSGLVAMPATPAPKRLRPEFHCCDSLGYSERCSEHKKQGLARWLSG